MCFSFSSRRRHTKCLSDWSSDVCSADLRQLFGRHCGSSLSPQCRPKSCRTPYACKRCVSSALSEIGRASCRERVKIAVEGAALDAKRQVEYESEGKLEYTSAATLAEMIR